MPLCSMHAGENPTRSASFALQRRTLREKEREKRIYAKKLYLQIIHTGNFSLISSHMNKRNKMDTHTVDGKRKITEESFRFDKLI